jgi:hypothetical protein
LATGGAAAKHQPTSAKQYLFLDVGSHGQRGGDASTMTANAATAPDGTNTGWLIGEGVTTSKHGMARLDRTDRGGNRSKVLLCAADFGDAQRDPLPLFSALWGLARELCRIQWRDRSRTLHRSF